MLVGEVMGRIWNDRQVPDLERRRLVVVRERGSGATIVAVDLIDVAAGNTVLVATDEAASAAAGAAAIDAAVVARVSGADVLPPERGDVMEAQSA
jgi:ethanolamine utilization protein EutN